MTVIKIKTHPQISLKVTVTDQMKNDYKECATIAQTCAIGDGKDCNKCSWNNMKIGNMNMCVLPEMERL